MPFLNSVKLHKVKEVHNKKLHEELQKREREILSRILPPAIDGMGATTHSVPSLPPKDGMNKSKGSVYELYVGSLYAKKGFSVEYNGIEKGNKDGGIDLICRRGTYTELVQCKCYVRCNITKKDICYFYGAVRYYAEKHIQEVVKGAYWTTRIITQKQQVFSVINTLGITLYDGIVMPQSLNQLR